MDPMWFYDEAGESEEWLALQRETLILEKEYLDLRIALRNAEESLRDDPGNEKIRDRVERLKARHEKMEKEAPWICSDYPWEFFLWGVPHG